MTDLEISKALALAIGHEPEDMSTLLWRGNLMVFDKDTKLLNWRLFDYRDWNVIAPIAEKFDCFPFLKADTWWAWSSVTNVTCAADTPQKAIAMAMIGSKA